MIFPISTPTRDVPQVIQEQEALGRNFVGSVKDMVRRTATLLFTWGATPSSNADAFYRLRTSNPKTIFDSKQISDNQPLFWDDAEVSGASTTTTYNANQASTTIAVIADTAGKRVRQTRRWFNYQPGKSQLVILTAVMAGNATKRIGQFNDNNGLFFQHTDTFSVGVRSYATGEAVTKLVPQSEWNIDKMDGTGNSGVELDGTKTNIYFIDYEWLGVGTVRYGVFNDGVPVYVHAEHNANKLGVVYMSSPNLPLRYEIENDGDNGASSLTHICSTIITEGGRDNTGLSRGISRGATPLVTLNDASIYPMFLVRLKSAYLGSLVGLIDYNILCTTTAEYDIHVIINPTIVGTAPSYGSLANSAIEFATPTNETTITGGTTMSIHTSSDTNQSIAGASISLNSELLIGSSISGTPDVLAIGVRRLTGTTETFYGSANFNETN